MKALACALVLASLVSAAEAQQNLPQSAVPQQTQQAQQTLQVQEQQLKQQNLLLEQQNLLLQQQLQQQQQGKSQKKFSSKQPGPLRRYLHTAVDGVAGATVSLLTDTLNTDLPPDSADNPDWPFPKGHHKSLYTVYFPNGGTAKISKLPDGSFCLTGDGRCITIQKLAGGTYAMMGEDGSMGTLTPRLDGGYTLMRPDGTNAVIAPRAGGGFNVLGAQGNMATILPGPGGSSHHVFSGNL